MRKTLTERFLDKGPKIYNGKYDYSMIAKINDIDQLLPIVCPEHGVFYKSFRQHIYDKRGCPECSKPTEYIRFTEQTFLDYCHSAFNDKKWSFEKTKFIKNKIGVIITCHEVDPETGEEHGDFKITPGHLRSGQGCPKCRYIKSAAALRRNLEQVISDAREVHGDKYDYSRIKSYKNDRTYCEIICHEKDPITGEEHGVFTQTMNNHIKSRQGCPKCGRLLSNLHRTKPLEHYEAKAREVHDSKYTYHWYDPKTGMLDIECPEHGMFKQSVGNHIYNGEGCHDCGHCVSNGEKELAAFVSEISGVTDILENKRNIIDDKLEIDIYVPDKNIAFEYDGLYWHSEAEKPKDYHLKKTIACQNKGIRLIHIFEDEWETKQNIVKSMIRNIFSQTNNRIYARKCVVKDVDSKVSRKFLDNNHLQGYCNSKIRLGLYYNNELVSLMTFGKSRHFLGNGKYEWELLRFCNKIDTNVVGGASKLLKYFISTYKPKSIVSYADKRWSDGNLYEKLGFTKYNESKPNYYYVINRRRIYRFNLRKSVLVKKYGCPSEVSEHEFCLSKKWYRIYDCGCLCYKMEFNG